MLQGWDFSSHQFNLEQISLARVKIQNFPFLKALDEMYGDSKYLKAAEFSSGCSLNLRRGKNWCELRNLELRETGFLGLRGDLFVKGNELSGQLEVGLPDHRTLLIRSKNRDELLANAKQEGGYFWIPVEVSGTPNAPQDNFASFVSTPQGASSGAGGVFDQLTR